MQPTAQTWTVLAQARAARRPPRAASARHEHPTTGSRPPCRRESGSACGPPAPSRRSPAVQRDPCASHPFIRSHGRGRLDGCRRPRRRRPRPAPGRRRPGTARSRPRRTGRRPPASRFSPAAHCANGGQQRLAPLHVAGRAHADHAGVGTLGREGEEVIERGDAVDAAGRQLQPVGDVKQDVVLKVAEELLGGVQHLDQGIGLEPLPLHARVEHLEPVVAAGMSVARTGTRGFLLDLGHGRRSPPR